MRKVYLIRWPNLLLGLCADCEFPFNMLIMLITIVNIYTVPLESFVLFSTDHLETRRAFGKSTTFDNVLKSSTNGNQRKSKSKVHNLSIVCLKLSTS